MLEVRLAKEAQQTSEEAGPLASCWQVMVMWWMLWWMIFASVGGKKHLPQILGLQNDFRAGELGMTHILESQPIPGT